VYSGLESVAAGGAVGNSLYFASWQWKLITTTLFLLIKDNHPRIWTTLGSQGKWLASTRALALRLRRFLLIPNTIRRYICNCSARVFCQEALHRIATVPGDYAMHVVVNWWRLWITAEYPARVPLIGKILLKLSAAVVCALGLSGAVFLYCKGKTLC
jgi:hypothetical protein